MEVEDAGVRQTIEVPAKNLSDTSQILGYAPIRPVIDQVAPGTPADRAGIREGDIITSVDGSKIQYWQQFMEATQSSNGKPMTLDVKRNGKSVQLVVTPKKARRITGEDVYQIGVLGATRSPTSAYPSAKA